MLVWGIGYCSHHPLYLDSQCWIGATVDSERLFRAIPKRRPARGPSPATTRPSVRSTGRAVAINEGYAHLGPVWGWQWEIQWRTFGWGQIVFEFTELSVTSNNVRYIQRTVSSAPYHGNLIMLPQSRNLSTAIVSLPPNSPYMLDKAGLPRHPKHITQKARTPKTAAHLPLNYEAWPSSDWGCNSLKDQQAAHTSARCPGACRFTVHMGRAAPANQHRPRWEACYS